MTVESEPSVKTGARTGITVPPLPKMVAAHATR